MHVAILGHHPDLFPGFNSLMTSNIAYGFHKLGAQVTVFLPQTKTHMQRERLDDLSLSVDKLDRFDGDFEIKIVDKSCKFDSYDLGIWQSYFPEDEAFFPSFKDSGGAIAKNFPRLLIGDTEHDIRMLSGTGNRFDIIGLALKTDFMIAQSHVEKLSDVTSRTIHMPRGFRRDWFDEPVIEGPPILGVEKGVTTDDSEYTYLIPVIEYLKRKYKGLEVIGARLNDPALVTKSLPLLPARQFYRNFLNPLWAYLMIDVDQSRQSMNAVLVNGRKVYPGMYENQVVEAQLAGAAIMGHVDALPLELTASQRVALRFDSYRDTDAMIGFLCEVMDNRAAVAEEAISWARSHHSVENMVRPLFDMVANTIPPKDVY